MGRLINNFNKTKPLEWEYCNLRPLCPSPFLELCATLAKETFKRGK